MPKNIVLCCDGTLEWLVREANKAGLVIEQNVLDVQLGSKPDRNGFKLTPPSVEAMLHQSLYGLWWLLEMLPRRQWNPQHGQMHWTWGPNRPRRIPENSIMHVSVQERMKSLPDYRPVNLPAQYQLAK